MKFLCLCGAYGSDEKFRVQLAPIINELTSDKSCEFTFVHGPCEADPPEGFEDYFGKPPYYRFIEPDQDPTGTLDQDILVRLRDFPDCENPEDTIRELMKEGLGTSHRSLSYAMKYLSDIIEEQGPFQGIIGYSEGATVSATFLIYEQRRCEALGIDSQLKYSVFFGGWPPADPETHYLVLSDESDDVIKIPTLHVIGSLDPYIHGSMALYNVCDQDTAYLFDHAKGHTIPRDRETVKELADVIRSAIKEYKLDDEPSSGQLSSEVSSEDEV